MGKKKSLGHSPFESVQKSNSEFKTTTEGSEVYEIQVPDDSEIKSDSKNDSSLDNLISTLLLQRDVSQKSSLTNSLKMSEINNEEKPFLSKMKKYSLAVKNNLFNNS